MDGRMQGRGGVWLLSGALALVGCGDDAAESRGSDSATATATATATAMNTATGSGSESATGTGETAAGTATETGSATSTTSGETDSTSTAAATDSTSAGSSTTTDPGSTTDTGTTDTTDTTGEPLECDLGQVPDTLGFTFSKKFDTGIPDAVLQATYYNTEADEVMVMSFSGKARRFDLEGTPLSEVFDVPPEAQPELDGATYDPVLGRGLLITQACVLTEVEPQTLEVLSSQQLGFGMSVCAGLALGLDNNLYIASYGTNEMVVLSRDGSEEIRRIDMIGEVGLDGFDGVTLIAGSENFLVMSTSPAATSAIIDGFGDVIVPVAPIGQGMAPLAGGMPELPDAVLTICGNGHAWLCEAYNATCFDYVPEDGDKNACPCLIPQ